jgi:hypothetical protein
MITIGSDFVAASILLEGGILWEPRFRLADDSWVAPLAMAPWAYEGASAPSSGDLAYIRKLGGAFLGLPFGGRAIETEVGGWAIAAGEAPLHGLCATARWQIADQKADRATIVLDFPAESAIASVEQAFVCAANCARIDVTVTIQARSAEALAIGYHPILRLPEEPGTLELRADFGCGYTAPMANGAARTLHGVPFGRLAEVPAKASGPIDLSRLPTGDTGEELLLLGRVTGPVIARYHDAGYDLMLDWDRAVLPNCLIWYHDRAAEAPPWHGRFRGIGIEPCASAFDFSAATSRGPNPLTAAGEKTSIALSPEAPTSITCSMTVEAIK